MRFKEFYLTEMPMYTGSYDHASNSAIHGRYQKAINNKKKFKEIKYDKYKILKTTNYRTSNSQRYWFYGKIRIRHFHR